MARPIPNQPRSRCGKKLSAEEKATLRPTAEGEWCMMPTNHPGRCSRLTLGETCGWWTQRTDNQLHGCRFRMDHEGPCSWDPHVWPIATKAVGLSRYAPGLIEMRRA